ncbi:RNA polymerase II transcriptional coactivator KELP [Trifolium medium]|uniref:RNA polymerase II transcriptional coactivator KELP n=1 Tax=Trifolium medium TaxID=97028 RepID=A0A392MDV1_9FABA|nr:RNA polymerase II transcriptional coactivator KELP [Trifolium medium]
MLSGINGKKNGEVASSVIDVPVEPVAIEPVTIEPVPIEPVTIEPVPIEIVRFDGKNFQVWAEQMELFLKQLKINYVLTEPCPNATLGEKDASAGETKAAEKRWVNDDLTCRRNILSHLSDNLFNKYANRKMSAKDLWEDLKFVYMYEEYGTKISQVKKYIEFQMVDEKAVLDQIQELNCIADSIAAVGMPIEENFHVSVIVSKLPLSWKDLSIKLMREEHLPFWKLMELITKEEESRNGVKQIGEPPSDRARFYRANEGGSSGADIKPPPGFQRKYEPNSKNVSCYICGQKGHFSKNCWRWL